MSLPMCAHWRHLAKMIKRQFDWFSRFCTAHGRKSLYFTMGDPFPQNCSFSWGRSGPHLIHDSLIIIIIQKFITCTCSQALSMNRRREPVRAKNPNGITVSSAVFTQVTAECRIFDNNGKPLSPQNCPFLWGIWTPI